ncbi:penicillin-binding protein 1A [Candidatus Entotheonella palauensis]|uniref:penicillin-binding protein 1A n=1 Tax=Candidatus Entotheonella palauensis TaxID=93172 RepID=UPI000B7CAFDE|nr:transglycosylase domain-containing protein [Candidatus Entotheonella palauensis]
MSGLNKRRHDARLQRPRRHGWLRWLLLAMGGLIVLVVIAGGIAGVTAYRSLAEGLPALDELEKYESSLVTHVYDRHGELIANFFTEKRILIELEDVPDFVRKATIAVEDARFYDHPGIDLKGVLRAAWTNYKAGRVVEGASTITMQVARTLFLNRERTLRRKLREMILAWRIEQRFSKDDILKMYLNQVFYGHNAYGVEAAAQIYFNKSAKELTLGEGMLIAGLTRAPNSYSPIHNLRRFQITDQSLERLQNEGVPLSILDNLRGLTDQPLMEEATFLKRLNTALGEAATEQYKPLIFKHANNLKLSLERRAHVIRRMVDQSHLSPQEAQRVLEEPLQTNPNYKSINKVPHFVEHVRRYLERNYSAQELYEGGWQVHTTLDLSLQRMAEQAVRHGVEAADKRHGYQRPFRRLALTGDEAVDQPLIEQVTLPPDTDPTVHTGEVLTGVVTIISPRAVWVQVKGGRGVMSPDEGFAWVRETNLDRKFEKRKRLSPEEIFKVGDVIRVRVVLADERNRAHQLILEQEPLLEGALIALEPASGHVLAMVGGYDETNQYNRATQALRQPGSAFKPFIYTAALDAGKTPASVIYDRAVVIDGGDDEAWKPQNYSQKYYGATTLRTALARSRNMVTVRLMEQVGVDAVRDVATRMGIETELDPYMSLALGSSEVKLLELTAAYGTFSNGGLTVPPVFITRIVGPGQEMIEENLPRASRAISPELAYIMTSLMQSVIQEGTGTRVKALGRPAAGKTGTTNDFRDAWFLGFTPELVTGVWVGFDDGTALGRHESGGRVASPIWLEFMQHALKGRPITDFSIPSNIRFYRINAEDGREVRGNTGAKTRFEAFVPGTAPAPPPSPTKHIREKIHRLDRQRSAARALEEIDGIQPPQQSP